MISRHCPKCDNEWHSANTKRWPCPECGMILDDSHNVEEGSETVDTGHGKRRQDCVS